MQLDSLIAVFSVPLGEARELSAGNTVLLKVAGSESSEEGTIELVSPVADAQSGTVILKVRLPNADGRHRSGEKCTLAVRHAPASAGDTGSAP